MSNLLKFRSEPLLNALRMKYMTAYWYLPRGHAPLELLEAYHTFGQLELIDAFIIGSHLEQEKQGIDSLFLILRLSTKFLPLCYLISLNLLLKLPFSNANSNNGANTDANEGDH